MPVDDLWYRSKRDPETGEKVPSRRHGRGKRWRVRWTDPETGEARTQLFDKKARADRHDANMQADISRGVYVDPEAGKVTVSEYSAKWRRQQLHRDSTSNLVERVFRLHVEPSLGHLQMRQVRASHLRTWVKDRSSVVSASSLRLFYSYLTSMFGAAVIDKVIGTSPCNGIRLPEIEKRDRFIPEPAEIHALSDGIADRYKPVPYVAAGCGLRGGELYGLEVEHIDFENKKISLVQQLKWMPNYGVYLGELKTKSSRRVVDLPDMVARSLKDHLAAFPPVPVTIEDRTDPRNPVERVARLVFVTATGRPVPPAQRNEVWRHAVKAAGLPTGFGLHGLRHYFATLLIHSGASVKTVQLALGHSSPAITLDTYLHEWPDVIDRTRSIVDRALGDQSAAAA